MAVKVYPAATPEPYEYKDGTGLDVRDDGSLLVTVGASKPIAAVASGKWERAEVSE